MNQNFLENFLSFFDFPFLIFFLTLKSIITNNIDRKIIKYFLIINNHDIILIVIKFDLSQNDSDGWMKTRGLQVVVTVIQRLSSGFVGQIATSNPCGD